MISYTIVYVPLINEESKDLLAFLDEKDLKSPIRDNIYHIFKYTYPHLKVLGKGQDNHRLSSIAVCLDAIGIITGMIEENISSQEAIKRAFIESVKKDYLYTIDEVGFKTIKLTEAYSTVFCNVINRFS
jgi:hypothetical protein